MLTLQKTALRNLYTVIFLLQYYLIAYHCTLRYSYISLFLLICTNIKHLTLTKTAFINIYMMIMAPYYHHAYQYTMQYFKIYPFVYRHLFTYTHQYYIFLKNKNYILNIFYHVSIQNNNTF